MKINAREIFKVPKKYYNWNIMLRTNPRMPIILPHTLYWLKRLLKDRLIAEVLFKDINGYQYRTDDLRYKYAGFLKKTNCCKKILSYEIMKIRGENRIVLWVDSSPI